MAAVSLSVSTVKPLGERVFVKVSASEEKTAGGILLPDTAKEKPQVGEVAAVAPASATMTALALKWKSKSATKFSTRNTPAPTSNSAPTNTSC